MFHVYRRLLFRFWKLGIAWETQYRANFLTMVFVGLVESVITVLPMLIVFNYADELRGWSAGEALALVGLFRIAMSVFNLVADGAVWELSNDIRRGDLDLILIRPIHPQFYTTFRFVTLPELPNIVIGVVVFGIGMSRSAISPSLVGVVQATIVYICGLMLLAAAIMAGSYIAFRSTTVEGISMVLKDVAEMGRYPISLYPGAAQVFLTGVMPVAFVTTFPIDALRGSLGWGMVAIAIAFATAAIFALKWWWDNSVRHYASASS